jgi:hypothetical protein
VFDQLNADRDFETSEADRVLSEHPSAMQVALDVADEHLGLIAAENRARIAQLRHFDRVVRAAVPMFDAAGSLVDWLVFRHGMTRFSARELVRVSEAIGTLPLITQAFAEARISWDQLRAVTEFATPDTDQDLVDRIVDLSPADIRSLEHVEISEPEEEQVHRDRRLRWWWDPAAPKLHFEGVFPEAEGSALLDALRRAANERKLDPETGDPMMTEVAMADALLAMGSKFLGADSDADRAHLLVITDMETLLAAQPGGAALGNCRHISNATLRRLACDARLQLGVEESDRGVVGIGRTSRSIPGWLRKLVTARDGGCRFPRCHRRHWVHVHHIVHWIDGGPTDVDNLITLCGYHHRLLHNASWRISGDPQGQVEFLRPDGSLYRYDDSHIPGVEFLWLLHGDPEPALAAGVEVNMRTVAAIRGDP